MFLPVMVDASVILKIYHNYPSEAMSQNLTVLKHPDYMGAFQWEGENS